MGIAVGAGTDIAIEAADVVIMGDLLSAVMDAHEIGRSSYSKTIQNLTLAFAFNGFGVPLAVTGLVHPVWAMVAAVWAVLMTRSPGVAAPHGRPAARRHTGRRRAPRGR